MMKSMNTRILTHAVDLGGFIVNFSDIEDNFPGLDVKNDSFYRSISLKILVLLIKLNVCSSFYEIRKCTKVCTIIMR